MTVYRSVVRGVGSYLPARTLTNAELAAMVDTSDEWIVQRTGIRERHIAAKDEKTSDLAVAAAKAALANYSKSLSNDLARHGIRVNSVNPTVTLTPMATMAWSEPAKRDPALAAIPLGRFAQSVEVALPVLFLLSRTASMISGVCLPINGGYTSR